VDLHSGHAEAILILSGDCNRWVVVRGCIEGWKDVVEENKVPNTAKADGANE